MKFLLRVVFYFAVVIPYSFTYGQQHRILQKPVIDSTVYGKWHGSLAMISPDGHYVCVSKDSVTTLLSMKDNWNIKLNHVDGGNFSRDRSDFFFTRHDTLYKQQLHSSKTVSYGKMISYDLVTTANKENWVIYRRPAAPGDMQIQNLRTNINFTYSNVDQYWFIDHDNKLLTLSSDKSALNVADLRSDQLTNIYRGHGIKEVKKDIEGMHIAFADSLGVWQWKVGDQKALKIPIPDSLICETIRCFNSTGDRLFLLLKPKNTSKAPKIPMASVDVWSYVDTKLQSEQLREVNQPQDIHTWVYQQGSKTLLQLDKMNENLWLDESGHSLNQYVILIQGEGNTINYDERNWNKLARFSLSIINTSNGEVTKVQNIQSPFGAGAGISPDGKYVIWYDQDIRNYFSYDISTHKTNLISGYPGALWSRYYNRESIAFGSLPETQPAGWIKNQDKILLFDQNDLFLADASGKHLPINLTAGIGKKHHYEFRLAFKDRHVFDPDEKIILNCFDRDTKANGFYKVDISGRTSPVKLTMQATLFLGQDEGYQPHSNGIEKAIDADAYLVIRSTASSYPNYYYTTDLRNFRQITNDHPEKDYNWLTSELITWKTYDGTTSQGILYKPENFDPNKKYPMILEYYQQNSEQLHNFLMPNWSSSWIDIPTYVSNGYLVFVPDVHYKVGYTSQSAVNCIESGAKYLANKYTWVDAKHIGINGHSFGGAETEMVIAHSHFFAAACAASGWSDEISVSNSINTPSGRANRSVKAEGNHMNLGYSLWQRPDLYIQNSAIFYADNVTTPLLMMNNKKDMDVEFPEGVQFFTALRSLGRRVWMLQYDDGDHTLYLNKDAQKDFSIRMMQFFDHYLKGKPAPVWITKGIPANLKGTTTGYEYDTQIKTPGPGLTKSDNTNQSTHKTLKIQLQ